MIQRMKLPYAYWRRLVRAVSVHAYQKKILSYGQPAQQVSNANMFNVPKQPSYALAELSMLHRMGATNMAHVHHPRWSVSVQLCVGSFNITLFWLMKAKDLEVWTDHEPTMRGKIRKWKNYRPIVSSSAPCIHAWRKDRRSFDADLSMNEIPALASVRRSHPAVALRARSSSVVNSTVTPTLWRLQECRSLSYDSSRPDKNVALTWRMWTIAENWSPQINSR